jgi:hydroxymethylbilane synthase
LSAVPRLVVGTRGSALALWQSRHVAALLRERHPGLAIEERVIRSAADAEPEAPVAALGVGAFVRPLEQALIDGTIDVAVHSLKDLPIDQPEELTIAAVPLREDARDTIVSAEGYTLESLPEGAVVGTGSQRRRSQLLHARPDLRVVAVRGNVDTRVRKLREGRFTALVLAVAGLRRLGLDDVLSEPLAETVCIPAAGQGALAVQTRLADEVARGLVRPLTDADSLVETAAERTFLRVLGGGCLVPASAHARFGEGGRLAIATFVGAPDGRTMLLASHRCSRAEAEATGSLLAERLLLAGGREILELARSPGRDALG